MNLTLRPSGGRGEYEFAGRQGELRVQDLFDLPLSVEVLPGVAFNAYSRCVEVNGKPRIRLFSQLKNAHPSSLVAAAMMLPKPRRERHQTHGPNLLRRDEFVVQNIRVDVVRQGGNVLLCPLLVRLENGDGNRLDINFAERMARVVRVWTAALNATGIVADAVRAHSAAFTSAMTPQAVLVHSFDTLYVSLNRPDGDILPLLEQLFGLGDPEIGDISGVANDGDFVEDVHIEPAQARIERARQWRLAAIRGSSATDFRREVRQAYDFRCLFSGQRLPRTEATLTAGVDAAHILPWSRFDLDTLRNGICLSKQCHWAFDEGLLRLNFDDTENSYVVSVPHPVRLAATAANFDIHPFDAIAGPIPRVRLPANEILWPSRQYLNELNRFLDGEVA